MSEPAWAKPTRPGERGWGPFAQKDKHKSDDLDVHAARVTPRYSTRYTSNTPIVTSPLGEISPLGETRGHPALGYLGWLGRNRMHATRGNVTPRYSTGYATGTCIASPRMGEISPWAKLKDSLR